MIDLLRRRQDYRLLFSGERGKRVLRDLMRRHFVLRSTQIAGDSHESAFNEGRRAVVLDILQACNADEDQVREMAKETVSNE